MNAENPQLLLLDDDQSFREMMADALSDRGLSVVQAENASAAKAWLSKHKPALLLVDVMMPDLNGLEFCRWLRAAPRFRRLPILVMSAVKDDETVSDALELGVADFLRKPFELKELWAKLEKLLPQR